MIGKIILRDQFVKLTLLEYVTCTKIAHPSTIIFTFILMIICTGVVNSFYWLNYIVFTTCKIRFMSSHKKRYNYYLQHARKCVSLTLWTHAPVAPWMMLFGGALNSFQFGLTTTCISENTWYLV